MERKNQGEKRISLQEIIDKLKKKGYRLTDQRKVIIDTFLKMSGHISAEDIFNELIKTYGRNLRIGLATIYRTLGMLKSIGVVLERNFGDGKIRYELVSEHHDHLICEECGKILEFFDPDIERIQLKIAKKFGFIMKRHRHELIGICSDCAKKSKEVS